MDLVLDYYQNQTFTDSSLHVVDCGYHRCNPSHTYGPHVRDYYLIHFVLEGEGEYICRDKVYRLKQNMGFVIFPGDVTSYRADRLNPWFYYWVGFKGSEAERLIESCGLSKDNPVFECKEGARERITALFHQSKRMNWNEYELAGHLYLFFSTLFREKSKKNLENADGYLEKAIQYIHQNYMYDVEVKDIADHLFIHRSYLYRIFLSKLKESPSSYILNYRLGKAAHFLLLTDRKVTDVAVYSGFSNASMFCRAFKQKFGVSPLKYRKGKR